MRKLAMKKAILVLLCCLWLAAGSSVAAEKMKVVILTGSNNHNWQQTTPVLRNILVQSGKFKVDVVTEPEQLTQQALEKYDVLLSNWNNWRGKKSKEPAVPWSDELKKAYVEFIRNGGGHVMIHAGSSSFFDWKDYQQIACATWELGKTSHGPPREMDVHMTAEKHLITQGMENFKTTDELWVRPQVQPGVKVLAEAYSLITKDWEPSAMVNQFGKGRCFTLLLGHAGEHMRSAGFQTLLLRGTEWAASGTGSPSLNWRESESSTALFYGDQIVWQFNYGPKLDVPYFHPVATVSGQVLTWARPPDHVWHHGLWFSWKFINDVNYWEFDPKTGRPNGRTAWSNVEVETFNPERCTF